MSKYRLANEYPGSPVLNTVVEKINNSSSFYKIENRNTVIQKSHVEDYPEYWEYIINSEIEDNCISLNKPCLSYIDLLLNFEVATSNKNPRVFLKVYINDLMDLIKSKL
jgi:hypothetical protein